MRRQIVISRRVHIRRRPPRICAAARRVRPSHKSEGRWAASPEIQMRLSLPRDNAGFCAPIVFVALTVNVAAFGQSNGEQPTQAPSPAPLTDRPTGAAEGAGRPAYLQLRYNEDWSFLRDESKRSDALDRIKYIRTRHLTLYLPAFSSAGFCATRRPRVTRPTSA